MIAISLHVYVLHFSLIYLNIIILVGLQKMFFLVFSLPFCLDNDLFIFIYLYNKYVDA